LTTAAGSELVDSTRTWCAVAARAASAKQGEGTVIMAMGDALGLTDAFVITSGANARQVRTITEEVELQVKGAGGPTPMRIEGLDDVRWVLMDYGSFVVHVFLDEVRRFYDLENLWGNADRWPWEDAEGHASAGPVAEALPA
jgi:ribosome-associated protein